MRGHKSILHAEEKTPMDRPKELEHSMTKPVVERREFLGGAAASYKFRGLHQPCVFAVVV